MNVFVVYCHPISSSFTFAVKEAFTMDGTLRDEVRVRRAYEVGLHL